MNKAITEVIKEVVRRDSPNRIAAEADLKTTEGQLKSADKSSRRIDAWMTRMAEGTVKQRDPC